LFPPDPNDLSPLSSDEGNESTTNKVIFGPFMTLPVRARSPVKLLAQAWNNSDTKKKLRHVLDISDDSDNLSNTEETADQTVKKEDKHVPRTHKEASEIQASTFSCSDCKKVFISCNGLNYHISSKHRNQKERFVCQFCRNKKARRSHFTQKRLVREHEKGCPDNPNRIVRVCHLCDATFSHRKALNQHLRLKHQSKSQS
jgi:hypothetical protein